MIGDVLIKNNVRTGNPHALHYPDQQAVKEMKTGTHGGNEESKRFPVKKTGPVFERIANPVAIPIASFRRERAERSVSSPQADPGHEAEAARAFFSVISSFARSQLSSS
jgi:hypothetical protein